MGQFSSSRPKNERVVEIYSLVKDGLNSDEIVERMTNMNISNLDSSDGNWKVGDIDRIIGEFNLKGSPVSESGSPAALGVGSIQADVNEVIITDIKIPFLSMVIFMVKWGLASIPALAIMMAILIPLYGVVLSFLSAL